LVRVSDRARRSRSVNTVGFAASGWWGDTTDGEGFVAWLATLGRRAGDEHVVMLGGGAAARSLGLALVEAGADAVVGASRRPLDTAASWADVAGPRHVEWQSDEARESFRRATLLIQATPLGHVPDARPPDEVPAGALLVD